MPRRAALRRLGSTLWGGGLGWILVAVSVGRVLSLGVRLIVPALLPQIKAEFALTNATAGLLIGALWASFATAQLPGGALADRIGERDTLTASMVLAAVAVGLIVLTPAFPPFVAGLVLFGAGVGLSAPTRLTVLSDIYPGHAATALSVSTAAANVGNAVLPIAATVIATRFAWRTGLAVVVPAFVLAAVAFRVTVPARTSGSEATDRDGSWRETGGRTLAAVRRRPVLLATAGMISLSFTWQGFTAFLPTYLIDVKGLPQQTAAAALGAFFVGGSVVQPVAGALADRHDERQILVGVTAVTAAALAAFPLATGAPSVFALSVLASAQLAFWPIVFAYVTRALPDTVQGSGFGLLRTAFLYLAATGPVAVGALADVDLFDEAFLLLAGTTVVTMLLATQLPRVGG